MKRARKAPDIPLTKLRFQDLIDGDGRANERRQVNLRVPSDVLDRVHEVADLIGTSKTATIIALLNEGLRSVRKRGVVKLPPAPRSGD